MASSVINDHPEKIRYPLVERPFIGFLLAFMAGSMNAWTLPNAQTFATVQSGNVVQSGYWLAQGDWEKFTFPFLSVIAFGLGSAFCGILMTTLLRRRVVFTPFILFLQAAMLVVLWYLAHLKVQDPTAAINPHYLAYAISFVAGMQGNAFHKDHGMLYGNVAVTFVVQMAFNFLIQGLFRKQGINGEPNLYWSGLFFLVLLGFASGGGIGFIIGDYVLESGAVLLPAVIALIIGIVALRDARQNGAVDPTAGGSFA
ncbi:YoaK family protein [Pseudoxanthobacter sp.]|uniref:YoaK family protein n=1 Tax=Pseudoxanthobacter sp. TaxID=1925742 RepID=UPI002FE26328